MNNYLVNKNKKNKCKKNKQKSFYWDSNSSIIKTNKEIGGFSYGRNYYCHSSNCLGYKSVM